MSTLQKIMKWKAPSGGYISEHSPAPTPSRAVYGFVMYLLSYSSLLLYLIWAMVPDYVLEWAGLDFLPQKYWAVAIPVYLSVLFFSFVLVIYPCLGMISTPAITDIRHVTDSHSVYSNGAHIAGSVPSSYDEHPTKILEYLKSKEKI